MESTNQPDDGTDEIAILEGSSAERTYSQIERRKSRPTHPRSSKYSTSIFIARSESDFWQARNLVRSAYSEVGYDTSFLNPCRSSETARQERTTLIAQLDKKMVGTFTTFIDGPAGLKSEQAYPEEIGAFRREGKSIVELGQFAVQHFDSLQMTQMAFSAMNNGLYLVCANLRRKQLAIVFEVHPHHVKYWNSLGWKIVGPPRRCHRVNAPGVLMLMEFSAYEEVFKQCWLRRSSPDNTTARAWDRMIRYSMLREDVEGALLRVRRKLPARFLEPAESLPSFAAVEAPDTSIAWGSRTHQQELCGGSLGRVHL